MIARSVGALLGAWVSSFTPIGVGRAADPAKPVAPAQDPSPSAPVAPTSANDARTPSQASNATGRARIVAVQIVRTGESLPNMEKPVESRKNIALGDTLLVKVENLLVLLSATRDDNPLTLFLDGIAMRGLEVYREPGADDLVRIRLDRNDVEGNKKAWVKILGHPPAMQWPVHLSLGVQDGSVTAKPAAVTVRLFQSQLSVLIVVVMVALLFAGGVIAVRTAVLRDSGKKRADGRPAAFSLARTQMALWFVGILIAFFLIWAVTGATDTINASLLALMGIGSATALGSAVVDGSKRAQAAREYADLQLQERRLNEEIKAKNENLVAFQQVFQKTSDAHAGEAARNTQLEIHEREDRLAKVRADAATKSPDAEVIASEGFLRDLLTDDNGYSLHRVQMAGWTVVLFVLFWVAVYRELAMPDFDATLLALMGISAGTYLGFKIPEQQTPQPSQLAPQAAGALAGAEPAAAPAVHP